MRGAIIINPLARKNRNGLLAPLRSAAREAQIEVFQISDFNALGEFMDQLHEFAPELLIISGGDGTAHAIISILGEDERFASPPILAILPHGTTNVTANDIGLKSPSPQQLARIMQLANSDDLQNHIITRRPIRVANLAGMPPQHGFIFGAGTVAVATKRCQSGANASGWTGNTAVAITLAGDLIRKIFGTDHTLGGLLETLDMRLETANGKNWRGETLTVLATTLNNLVLGAKPFWNQGAEHIHITRIGRVPDNFFTSLYHILYGNKAKLPDDVFQSFSDNAFELKLSAGIVIDGEFYQASNETPLKISTGPEFSFVRL